MRIAEVDEARRGGHRASRGPGRRRVTDSCRRPTRCRPGGIAICWTSTSSPATSCGPSSTSRPTIAERRSAATVTAPGPLAGQTVATLFAEPSTRTRVSFELAARALGGDPVSLDARQQLAGQGRVAHRYGAHPGGAGRRRCSSCGTRGAAPPSSPRSISAGRVLNAGRRLARPPDPGAARPVHAPRSARRRSGSANAEGVHRGGRAPLAGRPVEHLGADLLGRRCLAHGPDGVPARLRGVGAGAAQRAVG